MRIKLSELAEVPAKKLASVGILDSDQLLARASTPAQRKGLSRRAGVRASDLEKWAGVCDLLRVKGIGLVYAQLLVGSGIASVQDFLAKLNIPADAVAKSRIRIAEREEVIKTAESLRAVLSEHAAKTRYTGRLPAVQELAEMAEEAIELRPRLVSGGIKGSTSFQKRVMDEVRAKIKQEFKKNLVVLATFGGLIVFAALVLLAWEGVRYSQSTSSGEIILVLLNDAMHALVLSTVSSVGAFGLIALAVVCVLLLLLLGMQAFIKGPVVVFLFDSPGHREYYQRARYVNLENEKKVFRWLFSLLALLAFGLLTYVMLKGLSDADFSYQDLARTIYYLSLGFGIVAGILSGYPILRFYLLKREQWKGMGDEESVRRLLFLNFLNITLVPVFIVLAFSAVGPISRAHLRFYLEQILPRVQSEINLKRSEISLACGTGDEACVATQGAALDQIDAFAAFAEHFWQGLDSDVNKTKAFVSIGVGAAIWWMLIEFCVNFVFPYLVLGGVRKGIYYIILLIVVFNVEKLLQVYAPSWFGITQGSVLSVLVIAFFILVNALFFDWLYEVLSEKKKVCPGCGEVLDDDAMFCSSCGMLQP